MRCWWCTCWARCRPTTAAGSRAPWWRHASTSRAASKKAVRLDTFTTNVRAQNLYESCGFVNCGIYEGFYDFLGLSAVMYEHAL